MQDLPKAGVIIVAAGESQRMNGIDKILANLGNRPVIAWPVEASQQSPLVERIIIVTAEKNLEAVRQLSRMRSWTKVAAVCQGGQRRQDSVAEGLKHLEGCEWAIIHDGARPFLTGDLIIRGLKSAQATGAAIAAVPVTDTIKIADEDRIVTDTPSRNKLWAAQTPQIFRRDILENAYRQKQGEVTDDASLVERLGYKVQLFEGAYDNIKITTPHDLAMAEAILIQFVNPNAIDKR